MLVASLAEQVACTVSVRMLFLLSYVLVTAVDLLLC